MGLQGCLPSRAWGASSLTPSRRQDMRRTRNLGASLAAVGVGGLAGYYLVARPWHMGWGATREERERPMPGDELVREPISVSTRAITIQATPEEVWPWVVQIGMGRA